MNRKVVMDGIRGVRSSRLNFFEKAEPRPHKGSLRGVMILLSKGLLTKITLAMTLCLTVLSALAVGADNRFVDNRDGTVTDTRTGLMWAQTDNMGHITWHDAKLYCENFILSEYNDWRMPTIEELRSLFDHSLDGNETICGHHVKSVPQIGLSCGFLWSSETSSVPGSLPISAMVFNYSKGYQYSARMSQYRGYRALPVRSAGE